MLIQNVQDQIIYRAARSPEFRKELVESPRAVLKRDYNVVVPEVVNIKVVEDTDRTMTLALPPRVATPAPEVAPDELGPGVETQQVKITWTFICSSEGPCG